MRVKSRQLLNLVVLTLFLNLVLADGGHTAKSVENPKQKNCFFKCADQLEFLKEIHKYTPINRFYGAFGEPKLKYEIQNSQSYIYFFRGETSDVFVKYKDNWIITNMAIFSRNSTNRPDSVGLPFIKYEHYNLSKTKFISSSLPCGEDYELHRYNGKPALIIPNCDMGRASSFKEFSFLYWLSTSQLSCFKIIKNNSVKILNTRKCKKEMDVVADVFFIGAEWNASKISGIMKCYFLKICN